MCTVTGFQMYLERRGGLNEGYLLVLVNIEGVHPKMLEQPVLEGFPVLSHRSQGKLRRQVYVVSVHKLTAAFGMRT